MSDEEKKSTGPGVGMPAALKLDLFGHVVWDAFGSPPYLVGSALAGKVWRDIDVRLILDDAEYAKWFGGNAGRMEHKNGCWVAMCMAFSALGKEMTGLPIDFQIQQQTKANAEYRGPRSALGIIDVRITK